MLSRGKKLHQMRLMKKRNQVDMKVVNGVENRAPPSILDCYIFKTLLQHYFYKEGVRHLDYETINEGTEHEPSFRSTVIANNVRYDSLPGFSDPVEAEHSAAEVALIVLANSPDTRSRLSELMLTSGVGKNRLALYCQKMNYAPPMYECVGEPGNFCSFVVVGGIKYAGFVEHTEREADISACRTALTAIESAARASEDNIRNSIFTVVPQRNKVSDPGDSTQSRQGPTKTDCSSQGTTTETMEPERISIKMDCLFHDTAMLKYPFKDCSFQDTAMLKYPFKDDLSQNTTVAALEPKKGLVEIGCSGITGTRLDVMVDCSSRGTTAGALKPQENLAKKEDNTDAIDSGMAVIGISTNKTDLALKPKRCQMKRMQKKKNGALVMNCSAQGTTTKALEPREDLVAINCSSKCTIDAGLMVKMDGQAAEVGRISQEKAFVSSSDVNIEDNKAAIDSGMGVVSISTQENEAALTLSKTQRRRMTRIRSKARKMESAVLGLKMANNLEISEARQTGVVGVDAILKPNPKNRQRRNSALKTDSSTPGTNGIGLDVRIDGRAALESPAVEIDCLKVGSSGNGLAATGTGANSSFSDQGISAQQTVGELEPQKKWPVKTDYLSQGTTNAGFEVKLDCSSQGTQETDAAMKPSKGQMKRIRLKRNRALRKEAAVESTTTEPVVCQMANNSEICKARQKGVNGADAVLKSNPRKRQKRNSTLDTNSSTAGMLGIGLNVRIDGRSALESPTVDVNCLKVCSKDNLQATIGTSINSSFNDQGISAQQTVRELELQKGPLRDCVSQGATNAKFEAKLDRSSRGTTVKALEPKEGLVDIKSLSKVTIDSEVGLINQENAVGGSSNVNTIDNNAAIYSGMGMVSISTHDNDAVLKPSKARLKRLRLKNNRALKSQQLNVNNNQIVNGLEVNTDVGQI